MVRPCSAADGLDEQGNVMRDPDHYQDANERRSPDDENAVLLSKYQAQKCAAIISALADGHTLWADGARKVCDFLSAIALESVQGVQIKPGAAESWAIIEAMPWPPPGKPRRQMD